MFGSRNPIFGGGGSTATTSPANALVTGDVATDPKDAAQTAKLATIANVQTLLAEQSAPQADPLKAIEDGKNYWSDGTLYRATVDKNPLGPVAAAITAGELTTAEDPPAALVPAESITIGATSAALPTPIPGDAGKLYILRAMVEDEMYLNDGTAYTVQAEADPGAECYVTALGAVIHWSSIYKRWGLGSHVPAQQITVATDTTLDTRFASSWEVDAGTTGVTLTLAGDTFEPVKIANRSSTAALLIQPDGGQQIRVRARQNATVERSQSGAYIWVS